MDRKKKLILSGVLAAALLVAAAVTAIFFAKSRHGAGEDPNQTGASGMHVQQTETDGSMQAETAEGDLSAADNRGISAGFERTNTWESGGRQFAQYDLTVYNEGDLDITEWKLAFPVDAGTVLEQYWNCRIELQEGESGHQMVLVPSEDYVKKIQAGSQTQGLGFILSMDALQMLSDYQIEVTLSDSENFLVDSRQGAAGSDKDDTEGTQIAQEESNQESHGGSQDSGAAGNSGGNGGGSNSSSSGNGGGSNSSGGSGNSGGSNSSGSSNNGGSSTWGSPSGRLHVSGTQLVDESGSPIQLRGVSTHGIAWFPQYVNYESFKTLRDDWGANVVRLAMYTAEYGGYCSGGDQNALKQLIDNGVSYATELGLYVIIDWHVLNDRNPNTYKSAAIDFFSEMSAKYSGHTNVIYEICNEPIDSDWNSQIKPYAQDVIAAIRKNDSSALILVGTNTWSQDVDAVVGSRLDDSNVMYVQHFYAAMHQDNIRNKLIYALDNGIPVFVSECGICDASGNGGINYDSANTWLNLLNSRGVSFLAWSLSNKAESASLIQSWCSKTSGWTEDELTDSGKWFRQAIKG